MGVGSKSHITLKGIGSLGDRCNVSLEGLLGEELRWIHGGQ